MIATLINVILSSLLCLFAYQVNSVWGFLIFGWIVLLLGMVCLVSLVVNGTINLVKKKWILACFNFVMIVPLLVFVIPMLQLI